MKPRSGSRFLILLLAFSVSVVYYQQSSWREARARSDGNSAVLSSPVGTRRYTLPSKTATVTRKLIHQNGIRARQQKSCNIISPISRQTIVESSSGSQMEFPKLPSVPSVSSEDLSTVPDQTGVYAVLDESQIVRYIGITRKVASCVELHRRDVSTLTKFIKFHITAPDAPKEELQNLWKAWMQDAIELTGGIPDGNMKGNTMWSLKKEASKSSKPELRITSGKGLEDLSVPLDQILKGVVESNKVVAFIKGTRMEPACGFSYQVVSELTKLDVDFEIVNVLDEMYNPGVRDAIKEMSDWPTLPQLYVKGEFVGGCDIVAEMAENGQLKELVEN